MRTVTFQTVYDGVLQRLGLDPLIANTTQADARMIAGKITKRARLALRSWDFLEWSHTEERAFRPIWNLTRQFYRANPGTGLPDELFYLTNTTYYRVKTGSSILSDPPIGTLPTDTNYFEVLSPVDTFIELDQGGQHAIGQMLGVYSSNPRLNGCGRRGLNFIPSEMGIDVCAPCGPTVFIHYLLPEPVYSKRPYVPLKTYGAGERVFQPADGNVYRARGTTTNNAPPNATYWILEPVLEVLANYLEAGAYADSLRGTQPGETEEEMAARLKNVAMAAAEAAEVLEQEIDSLQAQGQRHYYTLFGRRRWGCRCASQPWNGGAVTTLTEEEHTDYIYPTPTPPPQVADKRYVPSIKSIDGSVVPGLATYATAGLPLNFMIQIYTGQEARLDAGPADPADPGQVAPLDYSLATNNRHWTEVS